MPAKTAARMMQGIAATYIFCTLASAQTASPRPWQQLQNPTAATVLAHWKTPPPEYGPEPYYGLNGPVTIEVIRRDLDNMQRLGYTAVTVQYGVGSPFGYLSPEYFTFFKQFVAEVKQHNMRLWIVDDAGYPSGFAGGKITSEHPELGMQALVVQQKLLLPDGGTFDQPSPDHLVSATAISAEGTTVAVPLKDGRLQWAAPAGSWTVYVITHDFRTSPTRSDTNPKRTKDGSQSLEDFLDPKATAQFLRSTHEAYKQAVGDEFGKTILGFRGDEPDYSIAGLPWTPRFFESFQKQKGYDIRPWAATFLQAKGIILTAQQRQARADYYDVFANLFRDGFFKPQADWCAANGLEYQVHLNHEELELQLVRSEGDFFRDMRSVQVPGIDSIWHQIWTDTVSDFPRLASSAAHIDGHPRAFTESFAAYRPTPDVTMARYIINEQLVRGVNLVETMYYPATSTPGRGPATFMEDPAYPALLDYTRRISYVMSMGRPAASVALLLPTASLWMGDSQADNMFVSSERLLSEHQIDFDVVDEDAITSVLKPGPGTLETRSGNRYRTVLIPAARAMSQSTIDRLKLFAEGGGKVLFLGGTPTLFAGETFLHASTTTPKDFAWAAVNTALLAPVPTPPAQPPTGPPPAQIVPADLLAALNQAVPNSELRLVTPNVALRYTHRTLDGATVFLLFNESATPISDEVILHAAGSRVERWDAQTATVTPATGSAFAHGTIKIPLTLAPYATEILVVR
jgi:hypothetical protein